MPRRRAQRAGPTRPRVGRAFWLTLACFGVAGGCGGDKPGHDGADLSCPSFYDGALPPLPGQTLLTDNWTLQSSTKVADPDSRVSTTDYTPSGWYPVAVPSTVLAALVDSGVYTEPFTGMNLRALPGMDYPVHSPFWAYPMGDQSPYRVPWWYRTEFVVPAGPGASSGPNGAGERRVWLRFDGINQRADIWLNGQRIAGADSTAGAFRTWEFDVTDAVAGHASSVLAVKVSAPVPGDLTWNWVDWAPFPPDKNMGITGNVTLSVTGPVRLCAPFVTTRLAALDDARLTVSIEAHNAADHAVSAEIKGSIEARSFSRTVALAAHQTAKVVFSPDDFDALRISRPRLWWPGALGSPELYQLDLEAHLESGLSDLSRLVFGVREVTSELTPEGHRLFKINGQNILIRGAGWAPDLLLRHSARRMEDELLYVRDMNLNAIRLEGKLGLDPLVELCDRQGVLVIAGWCCCDRWEMWGSWDTTTRDIALASLHDQIRRLRSHPSVLVWLNGSDNAPPPDVEQAYVDMVRSQDWPNPMLPSASASDTPVEGPSGVKMTGPYWWVPPVYWYADHTHGGAFGFNTETSTGAAVPPLDSLLRFIPAEHLWPIDDVWTYHGSNFTDVDLTGLAAPLARRFGPATDAADFTRKAQLDAYEGVRAMFEAFGRQKYHATGVIQWMLNNPWPGVVWHLYDYFLKPAGGYFGAKKACEPLHVQYSYDDATVVVVNSQRAAFSGLVARAELADITGKLRWTREAPVAVAPDASVVLFPVTVPAGLTGAYFLRLTLRDANAGVVSQNFYWLSAQPDQLGGDPPDTDPPISQYADYTALSALPTSPLVASATRVPEGGDEVLHVTLANRGSSVAFFVRVTASRMDDLGALAEVLPARWSDNYVSLLPGEERQLWVRYRSADLRGVTPFVSLEGWNVPPASVPLLP